MRLSVGFLIANLAVALNTHDVSGLNSTLWTMSSQQLPQKNWYLHLETYELFPFQFEKSASAVCFESREHGVELYSYSAIPSLRPQASPTCCFINQSRFIYGSADPYIRIKNIKLKPSERRSPNAVHFDVLEPTHIFSDFYCSSIIDDFDSLSSRKAHHPSLSEIDSVLGIGFRVMPDPISL